MTARTKPAPAPDELREQAARLRAEAAAAEAVVRQQEQAERDRADAAKAAWDREFIKGFDRAPLVAEVDRTRVKLEEALERDPLVKALAAHLSAQQKLRWMIGEVITAQGRTGRNIDGATPPPPPQLLSVDAYIGRTAERLAAEATREHINELSRSREEAK